MVRFLYTFKNCELSVIHQSEKGPRGWGVYAPLKFGGWRGWALEIVVEINGDLVPK